MAKLDERITNAILKLLKDSHPNWVTQEEIYIYLEDNLDFNEKQKQLHEQIRGQIEENWQHDARNLMSKLKTKGQIIKPYSEIYGLPINKYPSWCSSDYWEDLEISIKWEELISKIETNEDFRLMENGNISIGNTGLSIGEKLFYSRLKHFFNCGSIVEVGCFHKWHKIEEAFVKLIDDLQRYERSNGKIYIIHKKLLIHEELN